MREVGFTPVDELVDQLRELHAPDPYESMREIYCQGCDFGGWEGEAPRWPCRTAAKVYSEEEIAEINEAADLWEKWWCQMGNRNPAPWRGLQTGAFANISVAYASLADEFIADKVFPKVPVERNPITFRYDKSAPWVQVSEQLLEDK